MTDAAREEAERRWPHTGEAVADTARAARRLSFTQGASWQASQPITDAEVEAALNAFAASGMHCLVTYPQMRAALEAARKVGEK